MFTDTALVRFLAGCPNTGILIPRAISIISPITALAVGPSPAPAPRNMICPTESPSMITMLVPPSSCANGDSVGTKQGLIVCDKPISVIIDTPNSLIRYPISAAA